MQHKFKLQVERVNEGEHQEPLEMHTTTSFSVGEDGALSIKEDSGYITIAATMWIGLKVWRVTTA